jgi:hypothetical protein
MALTTNSGSLLGQQGGTNPLDKFQTFNCLFTLASLSKTQINNQSISRSNVQNIICRSQGIGNKGTRTAFGSYDYFIDDVIIASIPSISRKTGNAFATKISFKVFEPYSMGLFMLTMQQAAQQAGYGLSFKEAPYLLMIEFAGYVDGEPSSSEPDDQLTRYIPIKIISIKFNVGTTGSTYEITAIPYNEHAFREQTVKRVSDVKISGKKVRDLLAFGPTSLYNHMQSAIKNENSKGSIQDSDEHIIAFPRDYTDSANSGNIISDAEVYNNLDNNGVQKFPDLQKIFDGKKNIYASAPFKLEEDRVWHFTQEITIPDIITEVVIRSHYIVDQIQNGQFRHDANGMINWFRIETRVLDLSENQALGRQKRLYIYRVLPYKVHVHRFLPPGAKPPGYDNLKRTVARVYDYIYTGKNTEILNLELNFDMAFFTPVPSDASENVGQNNPSQGGITAGGKELAYQVAGSPVQFGIGSVATSALPSIGQVFGTDVSQLTTAVGQINQIGSAVTQLTGTNFGGTAAGSGSGGRGGTGELVPSQVLSAQRQFFYKGQGGAGTDYEKTSQVRTMQALLTNIGDMVNLNMTIMGDPYYIPTSGMGNLVVGARGENQLSDGAMNYQNGEVEIIINFRTPIDLNPTTGLYKFEQGIDIWSGLYQVTEVESRFNNNKFTQNVKGYRLRSQLGGADAAKPFLVERQKRAQENSGSAAGDSYSAGLLNPDTGGRPGREQGQGGQGGQGRPSDRGQGGPRTGQGGSPSVPGPGRPRDNSPVIEEPDRPF